VRCAGTEDLDRVVSEELKAVPGVLRTHTTVVLKTLKESTRLPLTHLAGEG
jgi:Lrp/AsnC family leucine-responsive transcriptional regulator